MAGRIMVVLALVGGAVLLVIASRYEEEPEQAAPRVAASSTTSDAPRQLMFDASTALVGEAIPVVGADNNLGCGVLVVPPEPEPCLAVQGTIHYGFLVNVQRSRQWQLWKRDNPGEYRRLTAYMATGLAGSPPTFASMLGAALRDVIQSYHYALGTKPLTWPVVPAPVTTGADRTPPSGVGGLQVVP